MQTFIVKKGARSLWSVLFGYFYLMKLINISISLGIKQIIVTDT